MFLIKIIKSSLKLNYEVKNINNKENYVKCLIRPEKISVKN